MQPFILFGIKVKPEYLIIAIIIIGLITMHTVGSCCHFGFFEGLENMAKGTANTVKKSAESTNNGVVDASNVSVNKTVEGFSSDDGMNGAFKGEFGSTNEAPVNVATWQAPYSGSSDGNTFLPIGQRPIQPIPLPEGENVLFATTKFSPKCCPTGYSTADGCACMTLGQYNYLEERGGNNVPKALI